jgi:hypothetical protein
MKTLTFRVLLGAVAGLCLAAKEGQTLLILLLMVGCVSGRPDEGIVLTMEHALPPDQYDYLWYASTAILISQDVEIEEETRKELEQDAEKYFAKWKQMRKQNNSDESIKIHRDIWSRYIMSFQSTLQDYPDHPYRYDLEKACQEMKENITPQLEQGDRTFDDDKTKKDDSL